jgi:hypothetical protein
VLCPDESEQIANIAIQENGRDEQPPGSRDKAIVLNGR